jgi:hypothetical protein
VTARRTDTQDIEVDADPADVLALLTAARRLPEWAYAFADAVEPAVGVSRWTASKEFPLRVLVHKGNRTVDYLPGDDGEIGGHTRVLPRPGGGAVVLLTQPLPSDAAGADAARATVTAELRALRALLDHQPPAPAGS